MLVRMSGKELTPDETASCCFGPTRAPPCGIVVCEDDKEGARLG